MAERLTEQQKRAVYDRGGKLLVSAAAGSGKTKVLVDRLMEYLSDPVSPANIDDFLIITYTKAAASELRGKIAQKIAEKIAVNPENRHLQQQIQRLYLAKISTVHSFCADILRENAFRMDLAADFRVADENECEQLKLSVMDQILELAYGDIDTNEEIRTLIDTQGLGRDDRLIPQMLLKVYHSAKCHLNPDNWLDWCIEKMYAENVSDVSETIWGAYLIRRFHLLLDGHIQALTACIMRAKDNDTMDKQVALLQETVTQLQSYRECNLWDAIANHPPIDYGRLVFSKKCSDLELAEQIKAVRESCKQDISKALRRFADTNQQTLHDLHESAVATKGLVQLVRRFSSAYDALKKKKRILDFSDLEHKTLDLLLGKNRDYPTAIATEIGNQFREIMVDEYQDSNAVQDSIFRALSEKKQNCFMVGDVKQSIYQFRLADPTIFIDKYNAYVPAEDAVPQQGRKVLLTNNFRSSGGVISAVNAVFSQCMSEQVGGLSYTEEEMLYEGIPHIALPEPEVELHAIEVEEDTYYEEATFVAGRIRELINGEHMVRDGETLRRIKPSDIVILLRSPGSVGADFCNALTDIGIHCTMGDSGDLLSSEEVSSLISLMTVVSNPQQDIPLVAVLTSRLFGFTADDLAKLRTGTMDGSIYDSLRKSTTDKAKDFLALLNLLRDNARFYSLNEFLERVLHTTDALSIYSTMPDGALRCNNIYAFCKIVSDYTSSGHKDLEQLLEYLKMLEEKGAAIASDGTNDDCVTIMSIHKSKGLEFPVVFLCSLSRSFNQESTRGNVLCEKDLGLGLNVANPVQRIQYPNVAKKAIASAIQEQGISEEMRVLYVAMTRARDRLIMTYAKKNLQAELQNLALRMDMTPNMLLCSQADCPGKWILQTALRRTESGELFALAGYQPESFVTEPFWKVCVVKKVMDEHAAICEETTSEEGLSVDLERLREALHFSYSHTNATQIPSKLTATQLKGRMKDQEIAENTVTRHGKITDLRKPSFIVSQAAPTAFGTAIHTFMQYADFTKCGNEQSVLVEAQRLNKELLFSDDQFQLLDTAMIAGLFATDLGQKILSSHYLLREFKFSVLVDAAAYYDGVSNEKILLQGVIDCAMLEDDGITVVDFKTDYVTDETIDSVVEQYREQVRAYVCAIEKIYQKPVKAAYLYFFRAKKTISI